VYFSAKTKFVAMFAVLLCFFTLSAAPALLAQSSSTGMVSGTVTDSSGAVVADATVTLIDTGTSSTRNTPTSDKGFYVFSSVDPGKYNVSITKTGFKTTVVAAQVVEVGRQLTVNATLEVGSVSSTVEVTYSPGSELQTMDATVGATLSGETLVNLPNTSRDASTLAVLQPGQNINGNVGGNASDQNTFQLDGGFATDDMSGDNNTYIKSFGSDTAGGSGAMHSAGFNQTPSAVVPIPVASVEEFKVSTANQTADFSGGAGSQVSVATKRGTNSLHGGVYDYYQDTTFGGANSWDNNNHQTNGAWTPFPLVSSHFSRFGADAGGKIPHSNHLGGDWYIFGLYEGFRFPQGTTFTRNMPLPSLRAGIIHTNSGQAINLNPFPVVDPGCGNVSPCKIATTGQTIQPTVCPAGPCDPRGLGTTMNGQANGPLNPVITLWNTYLPLPNDCSKGDQLNFCGYTGSIATPQSSNFGVARIDHDFPKGWHFNGTYHYYKLTNTVLDQWDVGGFFPGDTKGQYAAIRSKPQNSWIYTAGLTKDIKPGVTNDFHFSFTRNWWAYADPSGVPNIAGYPAALEIGGENAGGTNGSPSNTNPLFGPYNTNNQNTRTRYWNGHDSMYRDDVSWLKGSHLFQFGGSYQRNFDTHKRNDNGTSINTFEQYLIGEGGGTSLSSQNISLAGYNPGGLSSSKYGNLYSMVLGMVDSTQGLFSRGLGSLTTGLPLNSIKSCAISGVAATSGCLSSPPVSASSVIPTYSVYWTDSWRMKPKFTLNYGIGYTLEMPPYETTGGFQTVMVDQQNHIVSGEQYFNNERQAALIGQAYAPVLGFNTIRNVDGNSKYPYNPFYGGISPRIGAAWNLMKDTVVRGGYARIFGRINGVNPLLVPLLTPGLLQPATCSGPTRTGSCGTASTLTTPLTAFRVGVDGVNAPLPSPSQNLPLPWYPGVNDVATGAGETFDPHFRPNQSDEFTLSVQHQFGPKILAEAGYIGRKISNEIEYYSFTSVPYMMTLGGQSFANAWKNIMVATNYGTTNLVQCGGAVTTGCFQSQPFFEAALKPAYCGAVGNCTNAFVQANSNNGSGLMLASDPFDAWASVSNGGNFVFGRSFTSDPFNTPFGANGQTPSLATTISNGYGNYNAGYLQLTVQNWHGLTMKTNFTMSKALGTGNTVQASSAFSTVDPFNIRNNYGVQSYDEKFNFNLFLNYSPPFFASQKGVLGRVLGGWSISPLFVYGSGFPVEVNTGNFDCGTFGECNTSYVGANENMIVGNALNYSASTHFNTKGSVCGTAGPGVNVLANPDASCPALGGVFGDPVRNPILGLDGQMGGFAARGLPFWNLDLGLSKRIRFTERISASAHFDFTNVLNHMQPNDPCFNGYDTSTWGVLGCGGNVQGNQARRLQLGLTVDF
jgi:Carboxypeptidase regulatory-like domain